MQEWLDTCSSHEAVNVTLGADADAKHLFLLHSTTVEDDWESTNRKPDLRLPSHVFLQRLPCRCQQVITRGILFAPQISCEGTMTREHRVSVLVYSIERRARKSFTIETWIRQCGCQHFYLVIPACSQYQRLILMSASSRHKTCPS